MKWTTSQVIAALAVLSPILTSWITNRFKLSNTRLNFKQAKVRREERRIDDLEKSFEDYVKSTYLEINSTRIKFSENHNEIEAKLLIYANDELYKAITDFHWFIANNQSSKCRNKELRKIIVLLTSNSIVNRQRDHYYCENYINQKRQLVKHLPSNKTTAKSK